LSDKLALDLQPAHELRQRINKVSDPEAKQKLDALYRNPKSDLAAIRSAYEKHLIDESKAKKPADEANKILSRIDVHRQKVRLSVVEASKKLDDAKKRSLVNRLGHFLFGQREEQFGSMADHIREARREQGKAAVKNPGTEELKTSTRAERKLEETTYTRSDGNRARIIKLDFKDARAVEGLDGHGSLDSKKDRVTLITGIQSKDKELNFKETKVLVDYLKADLKKPNKTNDEKKDKISA